MNDTFLQIISEIEKELEVKTDVRDLTLRRSRELIRFCAHSIRAIHRHDFDEAQHLLATAREAADRMVGDLSAHPDLYYAGYTQDALKELTEANLVMAFVSHSSEPTPAELGVIGATYLRGMAEAATELRRFALDLIRRGDVAEAEYFLTIMDDVYAHLIALDFPDAVTGGLRRQTDIVRGVLERTRGDLTLAVRQDQMRAALQHFETRLGLSGLPGLPIETEYNDSEEADSGES